MQVINTETTELNSKEVRELEFLATESLKQPGFKVIVFTPSTLQP